MKQDTKDFLGTLLWLADDPDREEGREFDGKTIFDFSAAFAAGAEKFVDAFRAYLDGVGFTAFDKMERTFGGNVYFSLSGHGIGFFDERDEACALLQAVIQRWSGDSGRAKRFEQLESNLCVGADGKIDLCFVDSAIEEQRNALFAVPKGE